ncbi:MAG TPA: His/Gly/Thr/Pro-type tRNA ligase C-terminal domain-containing protein, partial [Casimicrobiaceae bacterium]|nr:His/Gly/Thr/Pro-type tRNA ligase C-terminal domain-containing protein [Casimicrobiaceae bacterium]
QMKRADASGARYALIIGDDEAAAGTVAVRPLRGGDEQTEVPAGQIAARIRDLVTLTKDDDGLL